MKFAKKAFLWIVVVGIFYFFLSHHIVLIGSGVKLLKKSNLTLQYTIFNAKGKSNRYILSIDELRSDGIGEILVEAGRISTDDLDLMLEMYEREEDA